MRMRVSTCDTRAQRYEVTATNDGADDGEVGGACGRRTLHPIPRRSSTAPCERFPSINWYTPVSLPWGSIPITSMLAFPSATSMLATPPCRCGIATVILPWVSLIAAHRSMVLAHDPRTNPLIPARKRQHAAATDAMMIALRSLPRARRFRRYVRLSSRLSRPDRGISIAPRANIIRVACICRRNKLSNRGL
jgi:hypothetical protein